MWRTKNLAPLRTTRVAAWTTILALALLCGCSGEQTPENRFLAAVTRADIDATAAMLHEGHLDVNHKTSLTGTSALETASGMGNASLVKLLLESGADPNIVNSKGMSPLQMAAYSGHLEIAATLIQAGADVNARDQEYGYTALAAAASRGHLSVSLLLLEAGADTHAQTTAGWTAEQLAANAGHRDIAKALAMRQSSKP